MENIFVVSKSIHFVADELKLLSIDKKAITEMGEPFYFDKSQTWIFTYNKQRELLGFICHNNDTILYAYILPKFRKMGVLSSLYNQLEEREWKTVSSNASLNFFLKKGFIIVKSFKNCHKLIKK